MNKYKRIVVKIGSNIITGNTGKLNVRFINRIVKQIANLQKQDIEVILVSSGAVSSGKNVVNINKKLDPVSFRQLHSAVGQVKLINQYARLFKKHHTHCAQVLATRDDFQSRRHYLNIKNCITALLNNHIVPIVNENDTTSVTELMFTDNDELSGLIATMVNAQALIILTNVDGIYTGSPQDKNSKVIGQVNPNDTQIPSYIAPNKSNFGRGGMTTKYNIAKKVANEGINVHIASGKRKGILKDLINNKKDIVNTHFVASKQSTNVKKWIAHSENYTKGKVFINAGAKEALLTSTATSLLFVGITKIQGEFEKDDIVKVYDHKNCYIGLGKVTYNSTIAQSKIKQKNQKPFIHYDYLHINN